MENKKIIDINKNNIKGEQKIVIDISKIRIDKSNISYLGDRDRFNVIEAIIPASKLQEAYYVMDRGSPVFQINEWLNMKNKRKNTGKKYSYILSRFLNYLNKRNLEYWNVNNLIVEDYLLFKLYGEDSKVLQLQSNIRYKTISDEIMVIKDFYGWLKNRIFRVTIKGHSKKDLDGFSYLYRQIYETDYEDIIIKRLYTIPNSREYIKWYTDEEWEMLQNSFDTLRDKAIIKCTKDGGMRIDEVISIKISDYDSINCTVKPSRSKSKNTRLVAISKETCEIIDNYMFTERSDAEMQSGIYNEYLFINLRRGENCGKEISYRNYYGILKRHAKIAGLPEDMIRTHSGRSTKAMELVSYQAEHPEEKLTDTQIRMIMGWEDIKSIEPYLNSRNMVLAKSASDKILLSNKRKKE